MSTFSQSNFSGIVYYESKISEKVLQEYLKNKKDYDSLVANNNSTLDKYKSHKEAIEWGLEAKFKKTSFKDKVKIEAVKVDSSSMEDEDVTVLNKVKIAPAKKSKKKVKV